MAYWHHSVVFLDPQQCQSLYESGSANLAIFNVFFLRLAHYFVRLLAWNQCSIKIKKWRSPFPQICSLALSLRYFRWHLFCQSTLLHFEVLEPGVHCHFLLVLLCKYYWIQVFESKNIYINSFIALLLQHFQ